MTDDMMMGERDIEAELQEKDEIIMSLRLNEHLLKDKLEISRRNMSKQLERINALEKENEKLLKQINDCKDYNALLYQNSMKKDKEWIKNVQKPLEKELEESIQESTELRKQNMELEMRVHILSAILLSDECSLSEKRIGEIKEEVFE